jgi:hypothetical protein
LEFSADGGTTWAAGEVWMPINVAGTLSVRDAADHSRSVSFGNLPAGATVSGNNISFTPTHSREIATPTLELSGSSVWASSSWNAPGWRMAGETVSPPVSGSAAINLSGGASLTLGADVALSSLTLNGSGKLVIFTNSHTFSAETVHAATGVKYIVIDGSADTGVWWTGLAGDNSMANGGNWEGGQVPAAGADVNFSGIPSDTTINADAGRAFGTVTMGDAMITFTNALTVAGFVLGLVVVLAEPAVHVLNRQVETVTDGTVSKRSMLIALSVGVGISLGLSMLRMIFDFSILYYLIPGYILSLGLSFFVPGIYTAIAFDSGGVASGPLTSTFILPLAVGACMTLSGGDGMAVLENGFGIVAMVAGTPLITIQLLGFRSVMAQKVRQKIAMRRILDADDRQLIEFM